MYDIVIILVLALAAQVSAFHMSSPLIRGKVSSSMMKMSLESISPELLTNHNMLLSAAVSTDVDLKTTVLAFLFIAAAIMGSVQDFLKAFDKKPQQ